MSKPRKNETQEITNPTPEGVDGVSQNESNGKSQGRAVPWAWRAQKELGQGAPRQCLKENIGTEKAHGVLGNMGNMLRVSSFLMTLERNSDRYGNRGQ